MSDVDPQLILLRRQYLQLFEPDFLAWPPPKHLKDTDVQKWLYKNLFDQSRNPTLPPDRYQMRVLKQLVNKIEKAIEDPDQDEISDEIMTCLTSFMSRGVSSEYDAALEKAYVTFTCIPEASNLSAGYEDAPDPTITLLERRHLISGSRTTGFRTWEASLHLAAYLLSRDGARLVGDKNILELGAGTGFLSILLARHLKAKHVTSTDGDEGVIKSLRENLALNDLEDSEQVRTEVLRWGHHLTSTWVDDDCTTHPYDVVIGADITYDKIAISALVSTLQGLFDMRPELTIIIAGVVRNADTFQTFRDECASHQFTVEDVNFDPKPIRQQKALFYAAAVPIKIVSITRS
ncbi:putative methyltransferase-domain-containing protein [Hypoxylon sp. FL1284]|nr:putative methyltransferase-domain-containing protein [Hypoxylon sp. FL1284]